MHSMHITVTQNKYKILFFGYKEQKPNKLLSHPCCKIMKTCYKESILQMYVCLVGKMK